MQSPVIMAFRKRMLKRGYRDISIKREKGFQDLYVVTAVEPLSYSLVTAVVSVSRMYHDFRF